uniref:CTP synthase n=3 Tax=Caenorhabditis japonica TaxID=281687 RepID=A0A8R1HXL7_CAEJA
MPSEKRVKYILVTGGVISGVGKGIISSSLGVLLKNNGYKVSAIKIDPYLNEDAGTFSPYEHGEVFVLDDGGEVDLDLGNYERFLDIRLTRDNNITTGKMFKHVMERERRGDYCGKTVQMIPHLTDAIVDWIERVAQIPVDGSDEQPDVCIIELGGTIGDIEGMTYLSAFERFQRPTLKNHLMNVHVSLILHPNATGEPKTKPMQNSVRHLRAAGLVPDLLICRSTEALEQNLRQKIAGFGMMDLEQVVGVHDVSNIYKVPLLLQQQGVLEAIIHRLGLAPISEDIRRDLRFNMNHWTNLSELCDTFQQVVNIALVGKYVKIADAYASVNKALSHAAVHAKRKLKITYVDSELLENQPGKEEESAAAWNNVKKADGVIVPGGFDKRGVEGMIAAAEYCRKNNVPYLGVCLGMQVAAVEFARNVLGIQGANSSEFNQGLSEEQQIVIDMPEHNVEEKGLGGTMRLGRRSTVFLTDDCILRKLYGAHTVEERHRHRYEVNPRVVPQMARKGFLFVGMGVDEQNTDIWDVKRRTESSAELMHMADQTEFDLLNKIDELCQRGGDGVTRPAVRMEMFEMKEHPYFVGAQFHPEYLSHPLSPSPPFFGLLLAATGQLSSYFSGSRSPALGIVNEEDHLKENGEEHQSSRSSDEREDVVGAMLGKLKLEGNAVNGTQRLATFH